MKKTNKTTTKRNASKISKTDRIIVVGSEKRGTGFALGGKDAFPADFAYGKPYAPFPKERQLIGALEGCNLHASGKPIGLRWVDSLSFLAERGATFSALPLSQALAKKLVKPFAASLNGKPVTVYLPASFNPKSDKLPHCVAADIPAGRVETRLVSDGRNKALVGKLVFA